MVYRRQSDPPLIMSRRSGLPQGGDPRASAGKAYHAPRREGRVGGRKRNPKRLTPNVYGLRQPARPYLLLGVLCLWLPTRRHCLFPLYYADR